MAVHEIGRAFAFPFISVRKAERGLDVSLHLVKTARRNDKGAGVSRSAASRCGRATAGIDSAQERHVRGAECRLPVTKFDRGLTLPD